MACNRAKGTSVPITATVCSKRLSSGGKRSMRAASTACTVGRHLDGRQGLHQVIGTALADQHPGLHESPDILLQKKRIATGALDQKLGERHQAG